MGFQGIALAVMAATSLASTGLAISNSQKDGPDLNAMKPPNALADESEAQNAARDAAKRTRKSLQGSDGRGSTILAGNKLGELGNQVSDPKRLLGL